MRFLFATRGIFPDFIGGAPRHSRFLIEHLSRMPCEIHVIHPSTNKHFSAYPNIREFYVPYGRSMFEYSQKIFSFIGNKRYEVGYSDGLSLIRYLKHRKFPCLFNHHGFHIFQRQYFGKIAWESPREGFQGFIFFIPRRWACYYAAVNSDYVISLGGSLTELIHSQLKIPEYKILELPNGVDLSTISKFRNDSNRIPNSFLFVGGLVFRKGLTFLIKALNRIQKDVVFYIVGDGPLKDWLLKHNRKKNVKILGRISDDELLELYNRVECFLLPSLQEGMPTVILEAMACHLPIIATDV
ncbi:glycosyltransferase family 4 protein, partial [candidate division WOR-3 bacterium]|nr:glycosyltransferase family 4 protein [candidate division WOR-3 bacterium]